MNNINDHDAEIGKPSWSFALCERKEWEFEPIFSAPDSLRISDKRSRLLRDNSA